jgi:hypothetical protein
MAGRYYTRKPVAYGLFQRDVLFFKTLALAQLAYLYVQAAAPAGLASYAPDILSLAAIALGYAVSIAATRALGIDGTYFGIELGIVEARAARLFPDSVSGCGVSLGHFGVLWRLRSRTTSSSSRSRTTCCRTR